MGLARQENDADRRYVAALVDSIGNASTVTGQRLASASRRLMGLRMQAVSRPRKRATVEAAEALNPDAGGQQLALRGLGWAGSMPTGRAAC